MASRLTSSLAILTALFAAGCPDPSSSPHRPPLPAASLPTTSLANDPSVAQPSPSSGSTAEPSAGAPAIFDPANVRLVLDDPRLVLSQAAADRDDFVAAARELEAALGREPRPTPDELLVWNFQLGKLRDLAGDPLGAARAFDAAASGSWPLTDYARFRAAELYGRADQHEEALSRARAVSPGLAIAAPLELVLADALAGKGEIDEAAVVWRAYLARSNHPRDWLTVTLRFARALLSHPSEARAEEAVLLARRVIFESSGAGVDDAKKIEADALGALPFARRKVLGTPTTVELLTRAQSLEDAGQLREAVRVTDGIVALPEGDKPGEVACGAWLVRGEALSGLRKKPESADAYGKAIDRCQGLPGLAKALLSGARASSRAGRTPEARQRYARLEKELPAHSYADDARLLGARAALAMGDKSAFVTMLTKLPDDYPEGDMVIDGLFELSLSYMDEGNWASATAPLERAYRLAPRERAYHAAGRLPYYLGRAYLETGSVEKGVEALASAVSDYPLSFYMALAHARLAERDPALAAKAVEAAVAREPSGEPGPVESVELSKMPFIRAVFLAEQGEEKLAKGELDQLGVGARTAPSEVLWAAALLLAKTGEVAQSHRLFRGALARTESPGVELTDWAGHYPAGRWRKAWEIAYPRPFSRVVTAETTRQGIPEALAYAIMREESAFDPRVTSSASAVGLMQLISSTARHMARPLSLPSDTASLKRPEINVALGCRYLSILRRQFDDNPLLAIPGYNAGGGAPKRWVAERPSDDFDLWVEHIPYEETRMYTKRVIGTMAAYEFLYARDKPSEALSSPIAASPKARAAAEPPASAQGG